MDTQTRRHRMSFRNMCLQYAEHGFAKQLWTECTYPHMAASFGVCILAAYAAIKVAHDESKNGRDLLFTIAVGAGISITAIAASFESLYG